MLICRITITGLVEVYAVGTAVLEVLKRSSEVKCVACVIVRTRPGGVSIEI